MIDENECLSSGELQDVLNGLEREAAELEDENAFLYEMLMRKHFRTLSDHRFITTKKRAEPGMTTGREKVTTGRKPKDKDKDKESKTVEKKKGLAVSSSDTATATATAKGRGGRRRKAPGHPDD